jgi:hypothetical protein
MNYPESDKSRITPLDVQLNLVSFRFPSDPSHSALDLHDASHDYSADAAVDTSSWPEYTQQGLKKSKTHHGIFVISKPWKWSDVEATASVHDEL